MNLAQRFDALQDERDARDLGWRRPAHQLLTMLG